MLPPHGTPTKKAKEMTTPRILIACFLVLVAAPLWSQTIERNVDPATVNAAVSDWFEPHFVAINPTVASRDRLFVFFPGSFATPESYREIVRFAASRGYHAIGLRYPNSWKVNFTLCGDSPDIDCHENVRLEILDGIDRSDLIIVPVPDSIQQRLADLLTYLDSLAPAENWAQFLAPSTGELIDWSHTVVSGHSQGGGHAAMIASVHVVDGALLFAGGPDVNSNFGLAPWLQTHVTPSSEYVGFVHVLDSLPAHTLTWDTLGLISPGSPINIAAVPFPYTFSNQLVTTIEPEEPGEYHSSVIGDLATPLDSQGNPIYLPVWDYMLRRVTSANSSDFVRGDINGDGQVNVADVIGSLGIVFNGDVTMCEAAADSNLDDTIDIADAIRILGTLFSGAPPLASPYPNCGQPLLAPVLSCDASPSCL